MALTSSDLPTVAKPAVRYRQVGVEAQFAQARNNVLATVAREGGSTRNIARITCFRTEPPQDFGAIGAATKAAFPDGPPPMSWMYVAGLFRPDVKLEIEAIAAVV